MNTPRAASRAAARRCAERHAPSPTQTVRDPYELREGVFRPPGRIEHREAQYPSGFFEALLAMQAGHFWYRGRHRFLLHALARSLARRPRGHGLRAIDVGCGCGGWAAELAAHEALAWNELAVADSSLEALQFAGRVLPREIRRYRVDLLDLRWENRWDVIFLLDVIEHLPDDALALRQVRAALAPGGLLCLTVPALPFFWSWYDELACHQRRYRRGELRELARAAGLAVCDIRYFMFFLSPLVFLSRLRRRSGANAPDRSARARSLEEAHRIPHPLVNRLLSGVFALETPLGHRLSFPWGTSLLGLFRKPG
jgi:SAM-dependent methyltransferase